MAIKSLLVASAIFTILTPETRYYLPGT